MGQQSFQLIAPLDATVPTEPCLLRSTLVQQEHLTIKRHKRLSYLVNYVHRVTIVKEKAAVGQVAYAILVSFVLEDHP